MDQNERQVVYYVYAIACAQDDRVSRPLPTEGIMPDASIQTWAQHDLLVIFSPVPSADFGAASLKTHLEDTDWARARVLAHQRVLAALLDRYTLLPLKFGTICQSETEVREMLVRHMKAFETALRRVEGSTEWGVKVYCALPALTEWVETSDETLQPLRASIAQSSTGAGFFLRKKLSRAARRVAEEVVDACVEESHRRLEQCAREATANPIQPREVHGYEDEMVLNGAYLVGEQDETTFQNVLADLSERYAVQSFRYELTGPWPPYNFAALDSEAANELRPME